MTLRFSDESVVVMTFPVGLSWKTSGDSLPALDHITLRPGSNPGFWTAPG